jgi:hypothetical protein
MRKPHLPAVYDFETLNAERRRAMFGFLKRSQPRLGYPSRMVPFRGSMVEEYVIPDEDRDLLLDQLYPFEPVPALDDRMYDLHAEKRFAVREFRVIRHTRANLLVSPFFFESGGPVVDWMPSDFRPGECLARRIRGQSVSMLTISLKPKERLH